MVVCATKRRLIMPKPKMSKERQGEIALLAVQKMLAKNGLKGDHFRRDLGSEAKELGVPIEELMEFYKLQFTQIIGLMVGVDPREVSLVIGADTY